ncbi:MAG: DnaJ domain-containing protein [Spirochaetales bacterium]
MAVERDFYQILEISRSADGDQIRTAYRRMAKRYHPDRAETADPEAFRRAQDAYETLKDPGRRRAYDEELARAEYYSRGFGGAERPGGAGGRASRRRSSSYDRPTDRTRMRRSDTGYGTPESPVDELNNFFEQIFGRSPRGRRGAYGTQRRRGPITDYSYSDEDTDAGRYTDYSDATEFVVYMSPEEAYNGAEAHLQLDLGGTIIVDIPPGVHDGQELTATYERGFQSQRLRLLIRVV